MTSTPAAGWYPDPTDPTWMRWWDGTAWSEHSQQLVADAEQTAGPTTTKLPLWAWMVIALAALVLGVVLSPIFTVLWLVVLITGIVALAKSTPTWLRFSSRKTAAVVTAISAVCFLLTGSVANAVIGGSADPSSSAGPTTPASVAFTGDPSTVTDTSSTEGVTALQALEALPVKGRAAKTGYSRNQFGQRWLDVDRNGCDTRNDILARDLTDITRSGTCRVLSGLLADPYTAQRVSFIRGQGTSQLVQIDHVVALSDAWQKGAQQLTADQRATFANDPLNLLAVDGSANAQKSDGDAATWLPKNKGFRCAYVARQVAVKATYGLWVTQAEHDAIARVLSACPDEEVPTSTFAKFAPVKPEPVPVPAPATRVPVVPAPAPVAKEPVDVYYANCTAMRAAGAAPIRSGDPGYTYKLDRDKDGIACE